MSASIKINELKENDQMCEARYLRFVKALLHV